MQITDLVMTSGWGNNFQSLSSRKPADTVAQVQEVVAQTGSMRGLLAAGLHRSYGDSALNSGGTLVALTGLNQIEIDRPSRIAILGAGATIRDLEVAALAQSLFPPVVPGTGYVTIGGAVAADIHGKSHHRTGAFSQCLRRIKLLLSSGAIADYSPTDIEFWATVGGLGLTGIILEVEMELREVSSNSVTVLEKRVKNLDEMIALLDQSDSDFEHTVAWIDLSGDYRGRGVVSLGNYGDSSPHASSQMKGRAPSTRGLSLPTLGGMNFITPLTVRAFNEFWYRKPLKDGAASIVKYMHPLDGVNNWNNVYGRSGFLQYQFVIDLGKEEIFAKLFAGLRALKAASFLGVLKKFGEQSNSPLSFPRRGWTLTLDYSVTVPGLEKFLREFDEELAAAGGRIYLIKDSRLDPGLISAMYPRINEWRSTRNLMDPKGLWQSDQARRLQLC